MLNSTNVDVLSFQMVILDPPSISRSNLILVSQHVTGSHLACCILCNMLIKVVASFGLIAVYP